MPAKIDALSKGFKGLAVETDPIGTFTALMQILSCYCHKIGVGGQGCKVMISLETLGWVSDPLPELRLELLSFSNSAKISCRCPGPPSPLKWKG